MRRRLLTNGELSWTGYARGGGGSGEVVCDAGGNTISTIIAGAGTTLGDALQAGAASAPPAHGASGWPAVGPKGRSHGAFFDSPDVP